MTIEIDKAKVNALLWELYQNCSSERITSCKIKECINSTMSGSNCLTYRYILFTALLAKSYDSDIDILSLQARDNSNGAFDARSLAMKVVFPFQKEFLGNVLDGSNKDPLVNKPGRFMRLSPTNATQSGDPKNVLEQLCHDLPLIKTSQEAKQCLGYMISNILDIKEQRAQQQELFSKSTTKSSISKVRKFMDDLLNQGFGGSSLVLVTTALYYIQYPDKQYRISPHPVNQSGTSQHQFSDLDLYFDNKPLMGTELKDKSFTASDIEHAADVTYRSGASSLLFVAGRQSDFASQPPTYYKEVRESYSKKGLYLGITSIDSLMDIIFASHPRDDYSDLLKIIIDTAEQIGAVEAQTWIYKHMIS